MPVTVEISEVRGLDELRQQVKDLPFWAFTLTQKSLKETSLAVQKDVVLNSFNNSGGALPSNKLTSRSNVLRDSILTSNKGDRLNNLSSDVFSNVIYAPLQEFGGTVKAKNKYLNVPGGPYLNIPLSPNKTAAGVMRFSAKDVFLSQGGFIFKSSKGNWIVRNKEGQNMFVLKKQVTVPARLGMNKAAENEIPTLLGKLNDITKVFQ